jgi:hypothetical protein
MGKVQRNSVTEWTAVWTKPGQTRGEDALNSPAGDTIICVSGSPSRRQRREEQREAARATRRTGTLAHAGAREGATVRGEIAGVGRFLEAGDLFPVVPRLETAIDWLRGIPVERTLVWIAELLAGSALPGDLWEQHQRRLAQELFPDNLHGRRARELVLSGQRHLLVPHVLIQVARLALLHGSREPAGNHEPAETVIANYQKLLPVMLVIAHHQSSHNITADQLAGPGVGDAEPISALEMDLAANLLSNRRPYAASMFDRSARRWIEIPAEDRRDATVNLAGEFEAATGVPFDDLRSVGITLWARSFDDDGPKFRPDHLEKLGLTSERIAGVLDLIGGTIDDLADEARREGGAGDYDSSLFGRRPLVRLGDGQVLILSPVLLLERTLGWLPRWDLEDGFKKMGKQGKKRLGNAVRYLRESTERQGVETLHAVAQAGGRRGIVYGEREIQGAYGTGDDNADVAIDWNGNWIVAEISSRLPMRGTAAGGSAAELLTDLNRGVLEKAKQIDATIAAIRSDESKLTGRPGRSGLRFTPVLVTTEGFPVTPPMTKRIQTMLRDAGYCQQRDTAPLVVIDIEGFELAEAVTETGGPDFPRLLAEHRRSDMRLYSFPMWLVAAHGSRQAPKRIMARWDRVLVPILQRLEESESDTLDLPGGARG